VCVDCLGGRWGGGGDGSGSVCVCVLTVWVVSGVKGVLLRRGEMLLLGERCAELFCRGGGVSLCVIDRSVGGDGGGRGVRNVMVHASLLRQWWTDHPDQTHPQTGPQ
jgi:hypothetical protein